MNALSANQIIIKKPVQISVNYVIPFILQAPRNYPRIVNNAIITKIKEQIQNIKYGEDYIYYI